MTDYETFKAHFMETRVSDELKKDLEGMSVLDAKEELESIIQEEFEKAIKCETSN